MIEYQDEQYRIFDAHTHWSKLMSRLLGPALEYLSTNEILDHAFTTWKAVKKDSCGSRDLKANMYAEIMDKYGIDKLICLPVFQFDVKFSIECHQRHPDRIVGFGAVKPRASERKLKKSFSWLKQNKVPGIKLHAQYNNFNIKLHAEEILRVLRLLEENKMIALFHTGSHFDIRDLNPLLREVDDLTVILGHMGLGPQADQAIDCAIKNPNVYLETSGQPYDYLIRYAIRHPDIGIDRILYGSDLPTLDPTVEMMKILDLPISASEKHRILYNNCESLLAR